MTDQITIILILIGLLGLFIWGRFRYDVVAVLGLLATVLMGYVDPMEAFSGFGHPATITVALVLILSYALTRSGVTDFIEKVVKKTAKTPKTHVFTLSFFAGCVSMFINNVASLAIFMPLAISSSRRLKMSPSVVLMPLSFGSILGGMVTLIGTPPNIIISTYRAKSLGESFSMFDFGPVGGCVALVGIIFVSTVGWRLVSVTNKKKDRGTDTFEIEAYISEVKTPKESKLVGKSIKEIEKETEDLDIVIFSLIHNKQRFAAPSQKRIIEGGDVLMIEGGPESIDKFVSRYSLEIVGPEKADQKILYSQEADIFEIVVPPASSLVGRIVKNIHFKRRYSVNLLGIARKGRPYRGRLKLFKIQVGDVLLIHGESEHIGEVISVFSLLPLAERQIEVGRRKRDWVLAVTFFIGAILLATFNVLSIQIALALATLGLIVGNVIPLREIYTKIDWPVIVLLGAMIPVGQALEGTGATQLIADGLLSMGGGVSPVLLLALILIITMTLSDILNNAATAIIMAPLAYSIANQLGVNPDAFLMAVAVGASCAFLTPIGHQNNALIMGAGGYEFGDYWKMGLPLEIIVVLVGIPAILLFWPLYG